MIDVSIVYCSSKSFSWHFRSLLLPYKGSLLGCTGPLVPKALSNTLITVAVFVSAALVSTSHWGSVVCHLLYADALAAAAADHVLARVLPWHVVHLLAAHRRACLQRNSHYD